jgi:hypothetical protein
MRGSSSFIIIVVVLFLLAFGVYLAASGGFGKLNFDRGTIGQSQDDKILSDLNAQSDSDEVISIEKDLNSTNLEVVDNGVDQTDKELK